jgi:hypothetical protein
MIPMLADAAPPLVSYSGRTAEERRIVVDVRGRAVVAVRAGIGRYPCAAFGDVGPLVVREAGHARIGSDGRFTFTAGEIAQRIAVTGVLRRRTHTIAGTIRVRGSIATGQRCASATLRYTVTRR